VIGFSSAKLSDAIATEVASTTKEAAIKGGADEGDNGDGGQPPVEPVLLGDGATISANPAEIKSPAAGETLAVDVSIAGGENVAGFQFTLTYDETALEFVEVKLGDYLPAGAFAVPVKAGVGSVLYGATAIGAKAVKFSGTLATVTFKVV